MKRLFLIVAVLIAQSVHAEPVVWNGRFYANKEQAQERGFIPTSRPTPAVAIEISKAKKFFVGTDALHWRGRNLLKRYKEVQGKMMMARQLNQSEVVSQYRNEGYGLHLQLGWINEQLKRKHDPWI